jgi:hypothetical protein
LELDAASLIFWIFPVSAFRSASVGTLKPAGQMSFLPPSKDGHQSSAADGENTKSKDIVSGHGKFIYGFEDWLIYHLRYFLFQSLFY